MIKAGLCSVCFKPKTPCEVVSLATKAKLSAIEWIGSVHVPAGDIKTAREVGKIAQNAGVISTYGSLFRLGTGEDIFPHLEAAAALGAHDMRIWAGGVASSECSDELRSELVKEAKEISLHARDYGIRLSCECHEGSLTDSASSQLRFLREVGEPNFLTYWQELLSITQDEHLPSLASVHTSGKLTNVHIYQYRVFDGGREMRPLSEGYDKWKKRFDILRNDTSEHLALIEYVRNYTEETLMQDAEVLRTLTCDE